MVMDTAHYDALGVAPTADEPEMWSAFQKLSAAYHPDRNTDDASARRKLQEVCAAYLVLSDETSRRYYDQFGRAPCKVSEASADKADYYAYIHAGNPFLSWIGTSVDVDKNIKKVAVAREAGLEKREGRNEPGSQDVMDRYMAEAAAEEKSPRLVDVLPGDEGDEELARLRKRYGHIRKILRKEAQALESLERHMIRRIRAWTSTDRSAQAEAAFSENIRREIGPLQSEVLGVETLQAVGLVYVNQAAILLRGKKFLGLGGKFMKARDKRAEVQALKTMLSTDNTIDRVMARCQMEENARVRKGGGECTDAIMFEYDKKISAAMLLSAWAESHGTFQAVVRTCCEVLLNDEEVPMAERLDMAKALKLMGEVLCSVT